MYNSDELWSSDDHLLHVNESLFRERYHRYYLKDIEAVVMLKTRHRMYNAFSVLATAGITFLFARLIADAQPEAFVGMVIVIAAFFGLLLLINGLRGPVYRMSIQTRLGLNQLPLRIRRRKAYALMDTLQPLIHGAQVPTAAAPVEAPGV